MKRNKSNSICLIKRFVLHLRSLEVLQLNAESICSIRNCLFCSSLFQFGGISDRRATPAIYNRTSAISIARMLRTCTHIHTHEIWYGTFSWHINYWGYKYQTPRFMSHLLNNERHVYVYLRLLPFAADVIIISPDRAATEHGHTKTFINLYILMPVCTKLNSFIVFHIFLKTTIFEN